MSCQHRLNGLLNKLEHTPIDKQCDLTVKEANEILLDEVEKHKTNCTCYLCHLHFQVIKEMVKRKLIQR